MEKFNILELFKRSLDFGFRYAQVVMDGDIIVMPSLIKLAPYGPNDLPDKVECGGHLGKRARNSVKDVGETWTETCGLLREQTRLDKLAKDEAKAKKSLERRQRSERQLEVREAGGSLKLSQAAKANPDQKSV